MADPAATLATTPVPEHREQGPPGERGWTDLRIAAVQHVAEQAAREVPGTLAARRVVGRSLPGVEVRTRGRGVLLRLVVGAGWPVPLGELAAGVRDHVAARTAEVTGLPVLEVDVELVVLPSEESSRRVR